ncbi:hypothetical protein [Haliangium sp.]|uniref:hypothetical protein n=1 Tax=Haliangium sp. TaxID=2663208 RepID=UPI003D0E789E
MSITMATRFSAALSDAGASAPALACAFSKLRQANIAPAHRTTPKTWTAVVHMKIAGVMVRELISGAPALGAERAGKSRIKPVPNPSPIRDSTTTTAKSCIRGHRCYIEWLGEFVHSGARLDGSRPGRYRLGYTGPAITTMSRC